MTLANKIEDKLWVPTEYDTRQKTKKQRVGISYGLKRCYTIQTKEYATWQKVRISYGLKRCHTTQTERI